MDKPKPLHQMTRMDAIEAYLQVRGKLKDAEQRIKDLEGEVATLLEVDRNELLGPIGKHLS